MRSGHAAIWQQVWIRHSRFWPWLQAYLDDFDKFCQKLGGATAEIMGDLLSFEVLIPKPDPNIRPHPLILARARAQRAAEHEKGPVRIAGCT